MSFRCVYEVVLGGEGAFVSPMTREELVAEYCKATGRGRIENWSFHEVYGLSRLVGIMQQSYDRHHHGQTTNPAFKNLWLLVNYLHWRCLELVRERRSI